MTWLWGVAASLLWIIPFDLMTGYGFGDWQWWTMLVAVMASNEMDRSYRAYQAKQERLRRKQWPWR